MIIGAHYSVVIRPDYFLQRLAHWSNNIQIAQEAVFFAVEWAGVELASILPDENLVADASVVRGLVRPSVVTDFHNRGLDVGAAFLVNGLLGQDDAASRDSFDFGRDQEQAMSGGAESAAI